MQVPSFGEIRSSARPLHLPPRLPNLLRLASGFTPDGLPVVRRGIHAVLTSVFASSGRRYDPTAGLGDPGLLGPGSATWQVLAETAGLAAGVRALLLQALHPGAVAGVTDHSSYEDDPLGRLERTSAYVSTVAFGRTEAALEVSRMVRAAHRRVRGTTPEGVSYAAEDPRLLVWVSITFTDSLLACDRLWSPSPVDAATADRFVDEQARLSALLDPRVDLDALAATRGFAARMRAGTHTEDDLPLLADLPRDAASLRAVLTGFGPDLAFGDQARDIWHFLRWPPLPPAVRAAYWLVWSGAIASLDPAHRRLAGVPTTRLLTAAATSQTDSAIALLRLAGGRSPALAASTARARGEVWGA